MDETIDLRPYVEGLVRRWWVILGAVIASVLIAVLLYFSQNDFQATALVAVTDPAQRLQFDERITSTLDLDTLLQSYPELAMSDGVLSLLLEKAISLSGGNIASIDMLREIIEVEDGSDPRLVRLAVLSDDPQLAADLANAWANTFVAAVDTIYGAPGGDVTFFNNQLVDADQQLRAAESVLVEFQSGSRMSIVDNQLLSLGQAQASYLSDQRRLSLALDDIRALQGQIEAGVGDSVTVADQLTALMLQLNIFGIYDSASASPVNGLQLQISPSGDLTSSQRVEQLALLDNLTRSTEASLNEIDVRLLRLEPRIFALQREKESILHQYEELTRNRDVAEETYMALARKINEVRIQSNDNNSSLRVASLATTPTEPIRSNLIITITIAGLAGLLISIGILLVLAWWKTGNERATE